MSLFFIDIEVRYPNTEFISLGAFFIKYLPKPIIVNGRSKSIINIKIQNPIVNLLYYNLRFCALPSGRQAGVSTPAATAFHSPVRRGRCTVRQTGGCRFLFHANIHWAYYKISSAGYRVPFAFSSLIFSDTPDVIYPTTYFSPVSISVKTTSVSQSPLTFTVPNSGCICSDLIMPSSFASAKVCFF